MPIKRYFYKYPNHCWVLDLTEIPLIYLKSKAPKTYLFNIIDHWSKYAWSKIIKSKDVATTT